MISVIIPVYNVENYLNRCVDSVLAQTYTELEIILVDDGSTDHSGTICDSYLSIDNRIKVYHKENGGLSDARNYGIAKANGQYLGFVDSDDYIHRDMYQILFHNMIEEQADVSVCSVQKVIDEEPLIQDELVDEQVLVYNATEAMKYHIEYVGVTVWNKLYKREFISNNLFPAGRVHEDEFVFHRIMYQCRKVVVSSRKLYYYVQRDGSIMNSVSPKTLQDAMDAYRDRLHFINEKQWNEVRDDVIREYMYYLIKKYEYVEKHPFHDKTKWLKTIIRESRDIKKKNNNPAIAREFRIFWLIPNRYRWYCEWKKRKK